MNLKSKPVPKPKHDYVKSTGNVFADLNLPRPEESLAKAELAERIVSILHQQRLTQVQAAAILKIDQPKVSALMRGRLSGFSIERLLRFLLLLGATWKSASRPVRALAPAPGYWWRRRLVAKTYRRGVVALDAGANRFSLCERANETTGGGLCSLCKTKPKVVLSPCSLSARRRGCIPKP